MRANKNRMKSLNGVFRCVFLVSIFGTISLLFLAGVSRAAAQPPRPSANLSILHTFGQSDEDAGGVTQLLSSSDGTLFAFTDSAIFTINSNGARKLIHWVTNFNECALCAGIEGGRVYGIASSGMLTKSPCIFSISKRGDLKIERVLRSFAPNANLSDLIAAPGGVFYFVSHAKTNDHADQVVRIDPTGAVHTLRFDGIGVGKVVDIDSLVRSKDGVLYVSTDNLCCKFAIYRCADGRSFRSFAKLDGSLWSMTADLKGGVYLSVERDFGSSSASFLYKLTDRGKLRVLHGFGKTDGGAPVALFVGRGDGAVYGTAAGNSRCETVFRCAPNGAFKVLRRIDLHGVFHHAALTLAEGAGGWLYGDAAPASCEYTSDLLFRVAKNGDGYKTLATIPDEPHVIAPRHSGLILGKDGAIYGLSTTGKNANRTVLYRLGVDGKAAVLGRFPISEYQVDFCCDPVTASDGSIYGAVVVEKLNVFKIFRIAADGSYRVVKTEPFNWRNASMRPHLLAGKDGSVIAAMSAVSAVSLTTDASGAYGEIVRIDSNGAATRIYHGSFDDFALDGQGRPVIVTRQVDKTHQSIVKLLRIESNGAVVELFSLPVGQNPTGLLESLTLCGDGCIYAIISVDPAHPKLLRVDADERCKVLSQLPGDPPEGYLEFVQRNFSSRIVLIKESNNSSVLYETTPNGGVALVRKFEDTPNNIIVGSDGTIYGTTYFGGAFGFGSVFRIDGKTRFFETLHSFALNDKSGFPVDSLLMSVAGDALYGSTYRIAPTGTGSIFKLPPISLIEAR